MVTVVIPFYNCPYIAQAIHSVLTQTYPNIEVIVVDDGSVSYSHLIDPYRSRVHYLGKANGGTASALNHGIRMASGRYVAWLSSDDLFLPHKIARQVAYMQQTGARISYTDYHVINEHNAITLYGETVKHPTYKTFVRAMTSYCPVNGCTVMITKELIDGLHGFDESFPLAHDYDLWVRTVLSGIDFHYINEPLTLYRRHGGMGSVRHADRVAGEVRTIHERYNFLLNSLADSMPG